MVAQKAEGPLRKRLVQILVSDPEPLMFHAEVIRRDGIPVGYIRAASYGHTLGGAVGLAMLEADVPIDNAWISSGTWTVEIADKQGSCSASLRPLYDPANEKIKR